MRRFRCLMLLVPLLFLVGCGGVEIGFGHSQPVAAKPQPSQTPDLQPDLQTNVEILVFTAKWCPACQRDKPHIDALRARGAKITVIDADERPDLVRKYRVRELPTQLFTTTFWSFPREFSPLCRHRVPERSDGPDYFEHV